MRKPSPDIKTVDIEIVDDDEDLSSHLPALVEERSLAASDPIAAYLNEIRKYPLLTKEQEYELAVRLRETGDPAAAEQLITANLRFVVKVAAEYARFGAKLIDLIQEGNVGLMHAVKEFNPYKGVRLITYAVWWIRGYIQEYMMKQHSMVKIGTTQNQRKLFYRLQKEKDRLERLGEESDYQSLSESLGIPIEEVQEMAQRLSGRDLSLDYRETDEDRSLMDMTVLDEDNSSIGANFEAFLGHQEELALLRDSVDDIKEGLNPRELEILEERLLSENPLKLQDIADKNGVTREAVRQMEVRLLKKIKEVIEAKLKSTLD